MGFLKENEKCVCETEACWSYADKQMLCLDTSSWRTQRPVVDHESCSRCGLCYVFCPTQCVRAGKTEFKIDLTYCKGCGVCAKECPINVIEMVSEGEYSDECFSK